MRDILSSRKFLLKIEFGACKLDEVLILVIL